MQELEAIQNDLSDVRAYLVESPHLPIANSRSTPLYTLPSELLSEIISLAVCETDNYRQIFRLSHVSRRLRDTVFDMSWLFTEADWDYWCVPLLEWWCRRARGRLLKIRLGGDTILSFSLSTTSPEEALLRSCSSQWGTMIIYFTGDEVEILDIGTGINSLLSCSAPSLHTLEVDDYNLPRPSPNRLVLDCAPAFRVLRLGHAWIQLPASHTSMTDLSCECDNPGEWARCLTVVQSCQSLQKLTLDLSYYNINAVDVDAISINNMDPILTSLVHLQLKGSGKNLLLTLGHLEAPTLESLSINFLYLSVAVDMDFYRSFVSC